MPGERIWKKQSRPVREAYGTLPEPDGTVTKKPDYTKKKNTRPP
jgi:hypothetical protein